MPYLARDAARLAITLAIPVFIATIPAHGQAPVEGPDTSRIVMLGEFPAEPDSLFVARLKRDAERAYERGRYERAWRMYRHGLAWRGDKYAQYMVGYMLFNGRGVRADRTRGTAWLKLAAERGDERKLNDVYNDAFARLTERERSLALTEHDNLLAEFGDRRVLRRLIRADQRRLRRATGSRVGYTDTQPLTVQFLDGQTLPGSVYYQRIRQRLKQRMDYLEGVVTLGSFEVLDAAREPAAEEAPVDSSSSSGADSGAGESGDVDGEGSEP